MRDPAFALDATASTSDDDDDDDESIPEWFDPDDDDDDDFSVHEVADDMASDNMDLSGVDDVVAGDSSSCSVLEEFSEDVSALILIHLSIQDICVASLVSKSLYRASRFNSLWKAFFHLRWNISESSLLEKNNENENGETSDSSSSYDYFRAYQQAHLHPHDLWITHWNCCFPADGLTPGRCCIPKGGNSRSSSKRRKPERRRNDDTVEKDNTRESSKCPTCRDFNMFHGTCGDDDDSSAKVSLNKHDYVAASGTAMVKDTGNKIHTPIRSMAAQTRSVHRKLTHMLNSRSRCGHDKQQQGDDSHQHHPTHTSSRRAFECAATFHRRLDTRQYEVPDHPTHFLSDLLFFNLSDPACLDGQWELEQLVNEVKLQQQLQEDVAFLQQENNTNAVLFFDHAATPPPLPAAVPPSSLSRLLQQHEMAHHSWHVVELTNPDWYRPILYQVFVQRPDCFTIYPSQGFIEPGQKALVTIGVRPLGSALAHAFETLNVQRDGLFDDDNNVVHNNNGIGRNNNVSNSALWADIYTEAHLPLAPFVVRYRFAMAPPESNVYFGSQDIGHEPSRFMGNVNDNTDVKTKQAAMLDYHWKQNVPTHQMRSIHLSAHVHAHYSFLDFFHKTCRPWDFESDVNSSSTTTLSAADAGLFLAPNLREEYPQVFSKAVVMTQKHISRIPVGTPTSTSSMTDYSPPSLVRMAEGPCSACRRLWGCREEECTQIFIMDKANSLAHFAKRRLLMQNLRTCIQAVGRFSCRDDSHVARLGTLLHAVFSTIQVVKATPWVTRRQKKILVAWEQIVDDYFCQISRAVEGKSDWCPWRISGTFKYALCTDSVFGGPVICENGIDEPKYLDPFRHLTHSPGFFCLGRQEDGNHDEHLHDIMSASSARYFKRKNGYGTTDIFMDHPISALQAAICMVQDPRSLLVHGLYDSIEYPGTIVRRPRLSLLQSTDDSRDENNPKTTIDISYSISDYINGTPPPGVGRFALSKSVLSTKGLSPTIVEVNFHEVDEVRATGDTESSILHQHRPNRDPPMDNVRGLQFVHLLWSLGAQLGLAVRPDGAPVFVDRRILIACQWMAISIMMGPLLVTLLARCAFRIPSRPVEYHLEDFPFELSSKLRFLTEMECGYGAVSVVVFWLALGRWMERHTDRDFFRVMQDHTLPASSSSRGEEESFLTSIKTRVVQFLQHQWDTACPLFLQRHVFSPSWNRRSREEFFRHMAFWRSGDLLDERPPAVVRAAVGRTWNTMFGDSRDLGIAVGHVSSTRKLMVAIIVILGSFSSSTPHFWLNLLTVLACSISLGMSVSLHSLETGRSPPTAGSTTTGSMLAESNLLTIVITSFLVGQLVGSSGGIMFLGEFVVTSVCLFLGGAGTVSASAMESWGCLFSLSSTAFFGYLLARVAIVDGVRTKRSGYASLGLSTCICLVCLFFLSVWVMPFHSHVSLIVQQPDDKEIRKWTRKFAEKKLQ